MGPWDFRYFGAPLSRKCYAKLLSFSFLFNYEPALNLCRPKFFFTHKSIQPVCMLTLIKFNAFDGLLYSSFPSPMQKVLFFIKKYFHLFAQAYAVSYSFSVIAKRTTQAETVLTNNFLGYS